jgi:hypothetical protein
MAFTKSPFAFFGQTYASGSDSVTLKTAGYEGTTVGGTVSCQPDNTIMFASSHGLVIGDRVRFTQVTTLPTGLVEDTDYYVKTIAENLITLSNTRAGSAIAFSGGTADNTCEVMGPLDELTASESSTTATGDWRKVVFGIMEMIYWRYASLATPDRPTRVNVSRSSTVDDTSGTMTRSYVVTIVTSTLAVEVTDE